MSLLDRLSLLERLADRLDPPPAPAIDAFGLLGYEPTPRQATFHAASEFDVLYGGAAGGGKTLSLLTEGLRACVRYPGIKVLAIRESYPQLAESFLSELARLDFAKVLGASYAKTSHDLTFSNGSLIRFRYCDSVADARLRLGSEIQLLLVDEATQQQPAAIDFLCMRLRTSDVRVPVLGVRLGSNPGGIGHGWARRRYVEATNHGASTYEDVVDSKPTGHMVRFVPARYTDNPHLVDYTAVLDAIRDPRLRAAYRDGSWNTFAGQVFAAWSHDRHVVRPFTVPTGWARYAGIDWGYAKPWAVVWGALDPDRRLWIYRELYAAGIGEADQARAILAAEGKTVGDKIAPAAGENVRLRLADPSMWNTRGEVNPISSVYIAGGCVIHKATNDRVAGWARIHSYLAEGPACRAHREAGWTTCPMLHVFDTCADLIRTLPDLPADKIHPEDVDTDSEDHLGDALRYLVAQLGVPRAARSTAPPPETFDERIWALKATRDANRGAPRAHDVLGL